MHQIAEAEAAVPFVDQSSVGILSFARVGPRTVVRRAYAQSPLKLLTPRNGGRAAWVYTSTYGGGLVDGDALSLSVEVAAGASAFVSTQASTKVYRSPRGTASCLSATVAGGGLLVLAPDPVVCFSGSTYRQQQDVDLAPDAALVLVDWLTAGRHALGERWRFDSYDSRLRIRANGRLVVYDAVRLRSTDGDVGGRVGRFNVLALVAVVGAPVATWANAIVSRVTNMPVRPRSDTAQTASALGEIGCVLRVAGLSVETTGRVIREHLSFLPNVLGDDPWTRKW